MKIHRVFFKNNIFTRLEKFLSRIQFQLELYIWNETVRYRCKINFMKLIYDPVIYIRIILFSTRVFCSRNVSNFRWFGISLFNFQFPSSKFPNRKRYRDKITFSRGTFFSFFKSKQHAYIYIYIYIFRYIFIQRRYLIV